MRARIYLNVHVPIAFPPPLFSLFLLTTAVCCSKLVSAQAHDGRLGLVGPAELSRALRR